MNTEIQPKKRTAQEVAELYAARKQYRASPEGKKASAEATRLLAIAKADDEIIMKLTDKEAEAWKQGDEETFDLLSGLDERADKDRRNMIAAEHDTAKVKAENARIETARQRAEADRYERHQQTFKPFEDSILAKQPDDFIYTVEIFLEAFDVPDRNRKTVTDALTNWAKSCSKRPNRTPRQRWELDREQARLFYKNYIDNGRHQKRHALRTKTNSPRIAQDA